MAINVLITFLSVILSLFIFWKRLKEDYSSEIIFSSIFIVYISFAASYFVAKYFLPNFYFWVEVLGVGLGISLAIFRSKIRFFETLEALVLSALPVLSLYFLMDSVKNSSFFSFIAFIVILILVFVFYFVDTHYKSFTWYKSGKVGLSGLLTLFLFFLIRGTIAIFFPSVLSFSGDAEAYISGAMSFGTLALILILRREKR